MAKKEKTTVNNASIAHQGTEIILPIINGKPMSYDEGIEWLKRKKDEEERDMNVHYRVKGLPLDGLVAFHRALAHKYGWTNSVPTPGFFGDKPPAMLGIQVSPTERIDVPFGRLLVPGIQGYLTTNIETEDAHPYFHIGGTVKKKDAKLVNELTALTEKFLKEQSIYKGRAIKVAFDWLNSNGGMRRDYEPLEDAPQFMDLGDVSEDDLIFGDKVMSALNIGLFTPLEQAEVCRKYGVPLKRGILLYGPYGTGKTMTAYVAASKGTKKGWTFIYLDTVLDLKRGLELAALYSPAVVFAEDIDRAVNGQRSVSMDEILNTLDGVDTKNTEIMTVLTTNHVENINPALLRPGRLDTLVEVLPPDATAAERLVKLYARDLLASDVDLSKVGNALAGNIPAFIREVTERAKIAAIFRMKGEEIKGKVLEVDVLDAAKAMETHIDMLKPRENAHPGNPELMVKIPQNHAASQKVLQMFKQQ